MARPLDEKRRAALIKAAIKVFAQQGLSAPTSAVSKAAKVSEGSLFTYFKTKDDLVEAVYRELRLDLAAAILDGFPRKGGVQARLEHVFRRWVAWGVDFPHMRKATQFISMSPIGAAVRKDDAGVFVEVDRILEDAVAQRRLDHLPALMPQAALKALAQMTMDVVAAHPDQRDDLIDAGARMLWGALSHHS